MYSSLAVLLLSSLAAANPVPQGLDVGLINDTPDPTYTEAVGAVSQVVTYDVTSLLSAAGTVTALVPADPTDASSIPTTTQELAKRASATCAPQVQGSGPLTSNPDSADNFVANQVYDAVALNAKTPSGYSLAFQDLHASNNALGYLGYTLLTSYDQALCASKCSAITGCMSFNIYFERAPTVNPDSPTCSNPPSTTYIKCAFWGGPISADNAANTGQYRGNFKVVISGSNGYVSNSIATPAGYKLDKYYANKAVDATYDAQGYKIFLGSSLFTGPFLAQLCADRCDAQTAANIAASTNGFYADGSPVQSCSFFNTYVVYKNTPAYPQGQYCTLYSEAWPNATYTGTTSGPDVFLIQNSYTFVKTSGSGISPNQGNKDGAVHQASSEIIASSLQPFCSSQLAYTSPATVTVSQTTTVTPLVTSSTTITVATVTVPASVNVVSKRENDKRSTQPAQQALSTPSVLSKYPATVVSSACSLAVTPITSTPTITISATISTSASTQVVTVSATATATAAAAATVNDQPVSDGTICAGNFTLQYSNTGTWLDGHYLFASPDSGLVLQNDITQAPQTFQLNHIYSDQGLLITYAGAAYGNYGQQGLADVLVSNSPPGSPLFCGLRSTCTGALACTGPVDESVFWSCNGIIKIVSPSWTAQDVKNNLAASNNDCTPLQVTLNAVAV